MAELSEVKGHVAASVSIWDWACTWKPREVCDLVLAFLYDSLTLTAMPVAVYCDKLKYYQKSMDDKVVPILYSIMRYCLHFKYTTPVFKFQKRCTGELSCVT